MRSPAVASRQMFPYNDYDFGCATAEQESAQSPQLLLKGYLDLHNVDKDVLRGTRFLFLGYKGSGKSAISEHLRLRARKNALLFVNRIFLADFPFGEFGQIYQGPTPGPARYPAAWSWLLLLQLMGSLAEDSGARSQNEAEFTKSVKLLRALGFMPTPTLQEVVLRSSSKGFKTSLAKLVEAQFGDDIKGTGGFNFVGVVETLRSVVRNFRSNSKHLLVVDGLDDILLSTNLQYESLAALILEASRLNLALKESGAPVKILVMCRTDIYERLPGPNKNKIRQDAAVHLDWYHDPTRPQNSNLIALANMKARVSNPELENLFAEHLPPRIKSATGSESRETRRYLLDQTRHTPRDFLQLLKHLQHYARDRDVRLTSEQVRNGIRSYSQNYFLPELKDELVGHLSPECIDAGFSVLGSMGRQRFDLARFEEAAKALHVDSHVGVDFLSFLFEFGALGNYTDIHQGRPFYTYRYRNRHSPFNPRKRFNIHRALLPALNIPHTI